jgi:hypothetical protein
VNTFVLEIWDDEGAKCTFYTVRWDEHIENETDKFFKRYHTEQKYKKATTELLNFVLKTIGEDHGAIDIFFNRHENEVKGLPSKGKIQVQEVEYFFPNFPLRLYALRLRENIVVLFNGGVKDGATNQKSRLNTKWREACDFAKKIDRAIIEKDILIEESRRMLFWYDGSEEIIL